LTLENSRYTYGSATTGSAGIYSSTATSYDAAAIYGISYASHRSSIYKDTTTASTDQTGMHIIITDMYVPGITQSEYASALGKNVRTAAARYVLSGRPTGMPTT
jgi:ClpP class serine protease